MCVKSVASYQRPLLHPATAAAARMQRPQQLTVAQILLLWVAAVVRVKLFCASTRISCCGAGFSIGASLLPSLVAGGWTVMMIRTMKTLLTRNSLTALLPHSRNELRSCVLTLTTNGLHGPSLQSSSLAARWFRFKTKLADCPCSRRP